MIRRGFRAMGTDMELRVAAPCSPAAVGALLRAEAEIRRLERLLSRFDPASELSELNRRRGMRVGPELLEVVELALEARDRTAGRFDPTVHDALVAAGYDRSFEALADDAPARAAAAVACSREVLVDRPRSRIELGEGASLDLGGIGKGYAADRAASILGAAGPCLVDAGGDLVATGRPWQVGVETGDGVLTLELTDAAVATSGRDRRSWRVGGAERHHIVDPASGRPAEGDLLRVTAVAPTAAEAEVLAKALFLSGAKAAELEADREEIPAVLVTRDGRTILAGGLA